MAKAADQFRPADVTVWGTLALGIWALAILSANLSGLIPSSVYGAMHASRLEGTTLNQLRTQVSVLEQETTRMRQENIQLLQRFEMNEVAAGSVTQRVGALEVSVPRVLEEARVLAEKSAAVDTISTGSIHIGKTLTFETDGGTVAVQQRPLIAGSNEAQLKVVPLAGGMPAPLSDDGPAQGIALGFPVEPGSADAQWQEMLAQVGTMLVGLAPVVAAPQGADGVQLVAGPMVDRASAIELCGRLDKAGIPCQPAPYSGEPMPLLN